MHKTSGVKEDGERLEVMVKQWEEKQETVVSSQNRMFTWEGDQDGHMQ